MFTIYTDKQELFEATAEIKGASLKKTNVRILLENSKANLLFNGEIDTDGKIKVPINKLEGLLEEGVKGKIKLEVISEGTLFNTWSDDFVVETSKKVSIKEVKSTNNDNSVEKPINELKITVKKQQDKDNTPVVTKKEKLTLNDVLAEFIVNASEHGLGSIKDVSAKSKLRDKILNEIFIKNKISNKKTQNKIIEHCNKIL